MRRRSATIFAEDHETFLKKFKNENDDENDDSSMNKKKQKSKSNLKLKEVYLEEYDESALTYKKEFEFEMIVPSLEDRISTDECDLYENINKMNYQIKNEKEICLKLLNNIMENKDIDMEDIFDKLSKTLSIDKSKITSGEDLKKFICENFELYEKHLKFLFVGNKNAGKTSVLNFIKNIYQTDNNSLYYECLPTTSLDISKIYVPVENHLLRIELWDSNTTIQNSKIFETYLKLCNSFIYVYKESDSTSHESLENFLKKLNNLSGANQKKNTLVICNDLIGDELPYRIHTDQEKSKEEKYILNQNFIDHLKRDYNFSCCKLSELDKNFLREFLIDFI